MSDPVESFRDAMRKSGLDCVGPITADGKIKRFSAAGHKGSCCWYILYPDAPVAGSFGCWKGFPTETWCCKSGGMSASDWVSVRRRWVQADQERKREDAQRQSRTKKKAQDEFSKAVPAQVHIYLSTKRVKAHGDIRQSGEVLILPLRDAAGEIHSLQYIAPDKRFGDVDDKRDKDFIYGGRIEGCFFTVSDNQSGPLVICEGYATGASIFESTGFAVLCAMNCGNLKSVAVSMRAKHAGREIIIAADNDLWTDKPVKNPGVTKAAEAAKAIGARLAVPKFKDLESRPTDFNDLYQLEGFQAVRTQIQSAATPSETDDEIVSRLAALPPLDYERQRKQVAEKLGCRESALDKLVDAKRPPSEGGTQGTKLDLADVEPWPEPVNGAEVLSECADTYRRYVVLPDCASDALALWTAHAHAVNAFVHSPRLNIYSPEKGCGKTTLRDVVAEQVPRPLPTENLSVAVLFRIIEAKKPTVLADEYDSWLPENEELRGLLNAGHRRGGQALRCEGENNEVKAFNVFGPAVLCGIGMLPGTLHDRSIVIRLERAKPGEVRERFDSRRTEREQEIKRKLARWCSDNVDAFENRDPVMPDGAFNRIADNWRPLFAIAQVAGGDWPKRVAEAFSKLTTQDDVDAQGFGSMLLADIRQVFEDKGVGKIFSADLVKSLCAMEDRPWPEAQKNQKPITQNWLAKRLKQFKVFPSNMRSGADVAKGYALSDFKETFDRYLPAPGVSNRNNATLPVNTGVLNGFASVTSGPGVAVANPHETVDSIELLRCSGSKEGGNGEAAPKNSIVI